MTRDKYVVSKYILHFTYKIPVDLFNETNSSNAEIMNRPDQLKGTIPEFNLM